MELGLPIAVVALAFNVALWLEGRGIPLWVWEAAGYRRTIWLFYLLVMPGLATLIYVGFVRPKLRRLLLSTQQRQRDEV